MTSGVFFDRLAARAWTATAVYQDVVGQEFLSALGDGVGIETGGLGDGAVAPVSEPERLEPGEEPALPLVEQAHQEDDRGLGFVRIGAWLSQRSECAALAGREIASEQLLTPSAPIGRAIQIQPCNLLPGETAGAYQRKKGLFDLDAQLRGELGSEGAAAAASDEGLECVDERAKARKMHAPESPKAALVKLSSFLQRVIHAPMRVAGEVGQGSQLAKHGHVDRGAERRLQLVHRGDRAVPQQADERIGSVGPGAHSVRHHPFKDEV